jgi:hypothetical protein
MKKAGEGATRAGSGKLSGLPATNGEVPIWRLVYAITRRLATGENRATLRVALASNLLRSRKIAGDGSNSGIRETLARGHGFTVGSLATLAHGVGANTARVLDRQCGFTQAPPLS